MGFDVWLQRGPALKRRTPRGRSVAFFAVTISVFNLSIAQAQERAYSGSLMIGLGIGGAHLIELGYTCILIGYVVNGFLLAFLVFRNELNDHGIGFG